MSKVRCFGMLAVAVSAGVCGCVGAPRVIGVPGPAPPGLAAMLAIGSAGYTGCLPNDNQISNLTDIDGVGSKTWNATCKGKVYLCSTVAGGPLWQGSYSCAPAIQ